MILSRTGSLNGIYFALLLILFLPEGLIVNFGLSSVSTGFFIASLFALVILFKVWKNNKEHRSFFLNFYSAIILFIIINFFIGLMLNPSFNLLRFLLSILLITIELFIAYLFGLRLISFPNKILDRFLKKVAITLLLLGIVVCVHWTFFSHNSKEMIFFTEPSHFSVVSSPFVIYYIISSKKIHSILFSIVLLLIAIYIQNLTMLFPIAIAFFLLDKKIFLFLVVSTVVGIAAIESGFGDYVAQRYGGVTGKEDQNLSSLVYLQGWEYIYSSIKQFKGFGIGFQQLGEIRINSESQDILEYMGYPLNQNDGAFLFSKIFVEFGWFGLVGVILILVEIVKFTIKLSKFRKEHNSIKIFIGTTYLSFIIPLFIRNSSYFNAAIFIFMVAFFCNKILKFKIKENLLLQNG